MRCFSTSFHTYFFCFWKNTTFCHSFKRDTTFFRLHIFFSFHLFSIEKTQLLFTQIIFLTAWLYARMSTQLSTQLFAQLSARLSAQLSTRLSARLFARLSTQLSTQLSALCPVIHPDIHPVIWCFPIWLTTSLSYPMATSMRMKFGHFFNQYDIESLICCIFF